MHYNYWSIHIKHYNLKTVLPYGYWPWEQKLSKKQGKLYNTEIMHYTGCCVANFTPYGPPSTWEGTTTINRWRRQNIRRGTFAVKTNEHKTKIYCNIYTTGIDVNQNYMVNSNNVFCQMNTIPGKKSLFIPSYLGVLYISTSQLNTKPCSKIIEPSGRKIQSIVLLL